MLGFASGVMIAASFWSLLDPAIARAEENGDIPWLVVSIGFGLGGLFYMLQTKHYRICTLVLTMKQKAFQAI